MSSSKFHSQQDLSQPIGGRQKNEDTIKLLLRKGNQEMNFQFGDEEDSAERSSLDVQDILNDVNSYNQTKMLDPQTQDEANHSLVSYLTKTSAGSCHSSHSIAMLKTHKCSSSTLQNILLRHAENHNLSVALPKSGVYFTTWTPFNRKLIYMDNGHQKYNIMASHMRFHSESRKVIEDVMTSDTKYITILRNPAEQFESMYTYYGWKGRFKVDLRTFLQHPEDYFVREPSRVLYAGRNPICFDNGLDARKMEPGSQEVMSLISNMASWFDLVLITEYLDESLILLKDLMCWSLEDVVYFSQNARHKDSVFELSATEKETVRKWNWADTLLYGFFNASLWQKIEVYGKERMSEEVAQLQSLKADFAEDCIEKTLSFGDERVYYPGGIKVNSFQLSASAKHGHLCEQMTMPEIEYLKQMRVIQAERFGREGSAWHLQEQLKFELGERTNQTSTVNIDRASGEKAKQINESSPLSKEVLISQTEMKDKDAVNMSDQSEFRVVAVESAASCKPLDNVAMIKTHKCSSSTLQNILLRRAEDHNLKIALPKDGVYFSNAYVFDRRFIFRDNGMQKYNIMASHMKLKVAKFPAIRTVMETGAKYITIFRNPADQYESMYTYYGWKDRFQAELHTFLQHPGKYFWLEPSFTPQAGRNPMCYDNGLDARNLKPGDASVSKFIATLDEWFDLVLIADYFDESLILLKDLMCWSLSDIVYLKQNARSQESVETLSPTEKKLIMEWNWADTKLYQYFNRTLWKKIDAYGREKMNREVKELQQRNKDLADDCIGRTLNHGDGRVWYPPGIKVDSFQVNPNAKDPHLCSQMTLPELKFLDILRQKELHPR